MHPGVPRGRFGLWSATCLVATAFVLFALAGSAGASGAQQRGLYVAVGDSITAGLGASTELKKWVELYLGFLQSNGSGVTDLLNLGRPGATSTDLRNQLPATVGAINESSDTKAVTISIGLNDILVTTDDCPTVNAPSCPFAGNLRAILAALNTALANDPGDETLQLLEYYNPNMGRPTANATRQLLLGGDGKADCSRNAAAPGLNDLIHCISVDRGAKTVDVLPIFDAAGETFLASDHLHPNDAGHLAIAKAFGGAATPTAPKPRLTLKASTPKLSRPTAGRPFTASILVTNADTGTGIKGQVSCRGKLSGKSLSARSRSSSSGRSSCTWRLPAAAHNKQFKGSITVRFEGATVSRSFSTKVR
jgi:lysophospholipase L1-like esterase